MTKTTMRATESNHNPELQVTLRKEETPSAKIAAADDPTTVDQFKTAIRSIRDILRTEGITGKDSFTHLVLFLTARFITKDRAEALKMDLRCSWEGIMEVYRDPENKLVDNGNRLQVLCERFKVLLLNEFDRLLDTKRFPFDIAKGDTVYRIVELLNPLDFSKLSQEFDLLGYLWEIHLESGTGKARDLGQFFTDRRVAMYMTRLCAPGFVDLGGDLQRPEYVCDPTMGTGGFLTNILRYYREMHPDHPVDWRKYAECIHGCDIDAIIATVARISMFLDSNGTLFPHLKTADSLRFGLPKKDPSYEVILANMPFGVKGITHASCCKEIKDLGINGTKSEPLFLQLMMQSLAPGGRCAVIVPDGVLAGTGKLQRMTRAHLMQNFELLRVISLKGKIFIGTNVQTSILFFRRLMAPIEGPATVSVEFWELEKEANNLKETFLRAIPLANIEASEWSLEPHLYEPPPEVAAQAYPTVTLDELCTHRNGKNIPKGNRMETGPYPYYGSNGISGYVDTFLIEGSAILIGDQGSAWTRSVQYISNSKFYPSNHTQVIRANDSVDEKFLFYFLINRDLSEFQRTSSLIPEMDHKRFYSLPVPIPPLEIQGEIVTSLDRILRSGKRSTKMSADIRANMRALVGAIKAKHPKVPLESVCTHRNGKTLTKIQKDNGGDYPVMGGGTTYNGSHKEFNREGDNITVSKSGASAGCVTWHSVQFWAGDCMTVHGNDQLIFRFLYYFLKYGTSFQEKATGSVIPHCKWDDIKRTPIPVPSLDEQREYLKTLEMYNTTATALENMEKHTESTVCMVMDAYLNPHE